jgi:uncharacterized protein
VSAPPYPVVGTQRWRDLLFLHWRVSADAVQATLPHGLFVDTHEGQAYMGIVPFFMDRVRPAFLPPVPWLSWFLELNVRTYVRDAHGVPGVWFYSLDCNQPVGVAIARRFFHLPYVHARMHATHAGGAVDFYSQRRGTVHAPWRYHWQQHAGAAPAQPESLEQFLVERYVLYAADARNRLYRGHLSHTPYQIHTPTLLAHTTAPATLAGFPLSGAPDSVLAASPVNVRIHPLQRLG